MTAPGIPRRGRRLTADEVALAHSVFGTHIDYNRVRVIDGRYAFFQRPGVVMAPDGCIWWPRECGNLACGDGGRHAGTFIHEMAHVMQHQRGVNVRLRGFWLHAARLLTLGLYDPYAFRYRPGKAFAAYNIEQQGDLARDIYRGRYPNIIR